MALSIPRSVRFPFGYKVAVRLVTAKQVEKANGQAAHGCWDGGKRTIYIDRALAPLERRYVMSHEMIHALADWQHYVLGGESDPSAIAGAVRR